MASSAIATMLAPMMAYFACRRIQRAHDSELALDILNQLESSSSDSEVDEKVSSDGKKHEVAKNRQ